MMTRYRVTIEVLESERQYSGGFGYERGVETVRKLYEQTVDSLYVPDVIAIINNLVKPIKETK